MNEIREIIRTLNAEQRSTLMIAFNDVEAHYIELPNNRFIGVHLKEVPNLIVERTEGFWSVGKIKH